MCQPAPGPRCFKDSSSKMVSLSKKAETIRARNEQVEADLRAANKAGNVKEVRRLSHLLADGNTKLKQVETTIVHTQRDVDGTRTGRKNLEAEIAATRSPEVAAQLEQRLRAADALRFMRTNAASRVSDGVPPLIRLVKVAA